MELSEDVYLCSAGETFDSIALDLYGDEKYASALLMVNPEICTKMIFDGGERLYLPIVDIPEEGQDSEYAPVKAPWK